MALKAGKEVEVVLATRLKLGVLDAEAGCIVGTMVASGRRPQVQLLHIVRLVNVAPVPPKMCQNQRGIGTYPDCSTNGVSWQDLRSMSERLVAHRMVAVPTISLQNVPLVMGYRQDRRANGHKWCYVELSKQWCHTLGGGCAAVELAFTPKEPAVVRKPIKFLLHILAQYEELGAGAMARSIIRRETGYKGRLPKLQEKAQKEHWDLLPVEYRNETRIPKCWRKLLKDTHPEDFHGKPRPADRRRRLDTYLCHRACGGATRSRDAPCSTRFGLGKARDARLSC